jgi:hypothetical protein
MLLNDLTGGRRTEGRASSQPVTADELKRQVRIPANTKRGENGAEEKYNQTYCSQNPKGLARKYLPATLRPRES